MLVKEFVEHFMVIQASFWLLAIGLFLAIWFIDGTKNIAKAMVIAYLVLVYTVCVLSREEMIEFQYNLIPFWSVIDIVKNHNFILLVQDILNMVMMMPIGFLLPFIAKKNGLRRCVLFTIAIEIFIELSQLVLRRGLAEWDDVIDGVIGCLFGYGVYKLFYWVIGDKE